MNKVINTGTMLLGTLALLLASCGPKVEGRISSKCQEGTNVTPNVLVNSLDILTLISGCFVTVNPLIVSCQRAKYDRGLLPDSGTGTGWNPFEKVYSDQVYLSFDYRLPVLGAKDIMALDKIEVCEAEGSIYARGAKK